MESNNKLKYVTRIPDCYSLPLQGAFLHSVQGLMVPPWRPRQWTRYVREGVGVRAVCTAAWCRLYFSQQVHAENNTFFVNIQNFLYSLYRNYFLYCRQQVIFATTTIFTATILGFLNKLMLISPPVWRVLYAYFTWNSRLLKAVQKELS